MPKAEYQGTVLAESDATVALEGNQYFPRESADMSLFSPSDTQYTCPWKGDAAYFDIEIDGKRIADAAWSYPDPKDAAKEITGYLAFDRSKGVTVS